MKFSEYLKELKSADLPDEPGEAERDTDGDGLSDKEEAYYGTDPNNPDTDGDGMSDGDEVKRGRNPLGPGLLKDYFIPHSGNNYKPHALHPARLAFYAIASIVIKFLILSFIISLPVDAWLAPDVAREEAAKIIDLTNALRQKLGVNLLKENDLLDRAAYAKTEDMLIKQYFAHMSPEKKNLASWLGQTGYQYAFAGENLAMGFDQADAVVAAWEKSPTHYSNLIDRDFTEIGVSLQSGGYQGVETAMIAQMFGQPKGQAAAVKKTVAGQKTALKVELPPAKTEPQVLAAAIQPAVVIPELKIVYPQSGLISNDENVSLKISHAGVDKLSVFDGDRVIWQKDNLTGKETAAVLKFAEGTHEIKVSASAGKKTVWAQNLTLTVDLTPPALDADKTKIMVSDSADKTQKIISAAVYLSPDTASARLTAFEQNLKLDRGEEDGLWSGRMIVYLNGGAAAPVIPASVTAEDQAGNILRTDISYGNIAPVKTSSLEQYAYIKDKQPAYAKLLSAVSSGFYKILLTIAIIALLLNIFIEIRKQHPHIIASSLGFIFLLFLLILI